MHLGVLLGLAKADGVGAHGSGSRGGEEVRAASKSLAAATAVPDTRDHTLDRGLAAERAVVL